MPPLPPLMPVSGPRGGHPKHVCASVAHGWVRNESDRRSRGASRRKRDPQTLLSVSLKAGNRSLPWRVPSLHLDLGKHPDHPLRAFRPRKPRETNQPRDFFQGLPPLPKTQTPSRFFTDGSPKTKGSQPGPFRTKG